MSDKVTYPLTFAELRPGRFYQDSQGNYWSKPKPTPDQIDYAVCLTDGLSYLTYDKSGVGFRELTDGEEFACVQPSKKRTEALNTGTSKKH